ncbi:hypothetical protein, partial [Enterobacter sp. A103]|uniref:hypothetical protein n=1 Tax=Enterobacter sp. A103 TaxID=3102785 RepID=UPI002ACA6B1A
DSANKGEYTASFTPADAKAYTLGVAGLTGFTKTVDATTAAAVGIILVKPGNVTVSRGASPEPIKVTGGNSPLTYVTSDPGVVTVSADGVLNFIAAGVAKITIIDSKDPSYKIQSVDFYVTVNPKIGQTLQIVDDVPQAVQGANYQLNITGGNGGPLQYRSSDASVVSVSVSGLMTYNSVGDATIFVTEPAHDGFDEVSVSFAVHVWKPLDGWHCSAHDGRYALCQGPAQPFDASVVISRDGSVWYKDVIRAGRTSVDIGPWAWTTYPLSLSVNGVIFLRF